MKKLAFVLFVAILALGMTGLASAAPWNKVFVDSQYGSVTINDGDKVKIVFVPTLSYNELNLDWGDVAGSDVKVKIGGQGKISTGEPVDGTYPVTINSAGKIKLKLRGMDGTAVLTLASLGPEGGNVEAQNQGTHAPEPASMLLLGSGLVGMAAVGRRKFFKK